MILTSFASTIGSTFCFLISRYLFKDIFQEKYKKYLVKVNLGIKKEGLLYLLFLRLSPIFPFFLINLTFGLTQMKWTNFYWISQLGMLPATVLFVNAGNQLSQINNLEDILTMKVIVSLSAIGLLPIVTKRIYEKYTSLKSLLELTDSQISETLSIKLELAKEIQSHIKELYN